MADIFHARARSPFEVVTPIRTPKRDREPRTRSDSPRRAQPQQVRTADQLLGLGYQQGFPSTTAPPPVPEHLRKSRVSPSRGRSGRLVYPVSPGGTEIRPPPPYVASTAKEPEEPVRCSPELPVLEKFDPSTSSIVAGDWLVMLGPSMSSLSPNAYVWWKDTVDSANLVYQKWLIANPLKRLKLPTTELLGRHVEGQFCRVEQKAVPMLLKSVGKEWHEDIVASRMMSAAAIVYKVVCKYQPGGNNERQQLLNFLSNPEAAPNCQTAVKSLRKWRRWMVRAVEVGVSLPDPSLQVRGLDKLQPPNLPASSEFRLQTLRTQSLLDQVPSQDVATCRV